jgi:hypothetical protein
MFGPWCLARNNPVIIYATRQIPNSDPKFHQPLIVGGVGKSTRDVYFVWVYSLACVS